MISSIFSRDVVGLAPFHCSDTAGVSARWERWLRAFELFADEKGVEHANQKKALMLHTAGSSVQDIFFTLDEGTDESKHLKAKDALNKYFKSQANIPRERLCFREMIEQFADGKGVEHADQKKALMLHTAGLSVQDIFFTLDEGIDESNHLKAKDALNKCFKPQANIPCERLCFSRDESTAKGNWGPVRDAIEAGSPIL